ncbi:hypothetical protein ABZ916_41290 [Streptomyces sp. NPDC046853]|uniref:hypothetical protein n=1 Tax=Streptomyces sp. NPDC046853 TaxID=3154920 RepID=UPI00340BD5ED
MKYVQVDWDEEWHGFRVDPREYLAALPTLRGALPAGAWAFASDAQHYAFANVRCVKDLELTDISLPTRTARGTGRASLTFAPNKWKHDEGLRIEYEGVTRFSIDYARSIDWAQTITLLLDEVLPCEARGGGECEAGCGGVTHEIELTDATITVHCTDLTATWEQPPA